VLDVSNRGVGVPHLKILVNEPCRSFLQNSQCDAVPQPDGPRMPARMEPRRAQETRIFDDDKCAMLPVATDHPLATRKQRASTSRSAWPTRRARLETRSRRRESWPRGPMESARAQRSARALRGNHPAHSARGRWLRLSPTSPSEQRFALPRIRCLYWSRSFFEKI
jgi:hypothetical protein